jgi:pimeloyl-ACP methyl ester carboxylesterase
MFVPGVPTWSFTYRALIRTRAEHHRCIALDHLGFGLSDKPSTFSYHPELLAANQVQVQQFAHIGHFPHEELDIHPLCAILEAFLADSSPPAGIWPHRQERRGYACSGQ